MAAAISGTQALPFASSCHLSPSDTRTCPPTFVTCTLTSGATLSLEESSTNGIKSSACHWNRQASIQSTRREFYHLLQKCIHDRDTDLGEEVYSKIVESGQLLDTFLGCHLIRMFASFGDLTRANEIFHELRAPSVYAWSAIISAHANLGSYEGAVDLYAEMRKSALEPDGHIFVSALRACTSTVSFVCGMLLHHDLIEMGHDICLHVNNSLISMYMKGGSLQDACVLFSIVEKKDVVSWNSMIGGFGEQGMVQEALDSFFCMSEEGFQPDNVSCICCLSACSKDITIQNGRQVHTYLIKCGFEAHIDVVFALIEMYLLFGYLEDAKMILDARGDDSEALEIMVLTYFSHGLDKEILQLMQQIRRKGILCTVKTFVLALRACASIEDLDHGWKVHCSIIENGFEQDKYVGNTLIDLYGKCHSLDDAKVTFQRLQQQDVVSWSALISGHVDQGCFKDALRFFREMQMEGLEPNEVTFSCILKACSGEEHSENGLECGRRIHSLIVGEGIEQEDIVESSLVDMYAKCGNLEYACMVINKRHTDDIVTWSALMAGFVQHGYGQEALDCFKQMQNRGLKPTSYTIAGVLKACSFVAAIEQIKQVHHYTICRGLEFDSVLGSALVNAYARCGCLSDACAVFQSLKSPDVISWGSMITSFAQHNDYDSAIQCFVDMEEHGLRPNSTIFTCLLSACTHAGLIEEGCRHFKSIREHYGDCPVLEHYYSMVELLGHKGYVDEAEDLIESVPFHSTIVGWMSLLGASQHHGNVDLGKRCFQHALRIDPGYSSIYRLMSKLYAGAGLLHDAERTEGLRVEANAWKKPAKAFIEIDNDVHCFTVGDESHPRSQEIYAKLKSLSADSKNEGYSAYTKLAPNLKDTTKVEGEVSVHSEKLAIAFGLISMPEGSTIRVSKNLRVCQDCHADAKLISKVEARDIIIADAYQIHHFHDGTCSCVNSW